MLRALVRDLRAHKGRVSMTLVAIVLGVTFVVATWVISDSIAKTVMGAGTRTDVGVSVQSAEREPGLSQGDRDQLAATPGVTKTEGVLIGRAALVGADGKLVAGWHDRAGTDWDGSPRFELVDGRAPAGSGEVALREVEARAAELAVGDTARVLLAGGREDSAVVVGVFAYRALGLEGPPSVAYPEPVALRLLGDRFDRVELTAAPGTDLTALAGTVRQRVGNDHTVATGAELAEEARREAESAAWSTRTALLAFAAVALLVGMFVIANTFAMLVTQRTRQFGLLRAIGASRAQVRRAVVGEAGVLGLVGATIGVALGAGLGLLALWTFRSEGETVDYAVSPTAILVGYAVGVLVTVLAAYGSARRAAAVAPMDALRTDPLTAVPLPGERLARSVAGVIALVIGAAAIVATAGTNLDNTERVVGMAGGILGWLGVLLLAPALARAVLRPLAALVGGRSSTAARLGVRNAQRDPRRTAATASALMVGLALVCAFATLGETLVTSLGSSVRATVPATTTIVQPASRGAALDATVLEKVRSLPGVDTVAADRDAYVGIRHPGGQTATTLSAIEPEAIGTVLRPQLTDGSADLRRGVIMAKNQAAMLNVRVGDELTLGFGRDEQAFDPRRSVRTSVVGLYEGTEFQPSLYLDVAAAPTTLRDEITGVYATGGDPAAVRSAIDAAFRDRPDVVVTDRDGVVEDVTGQFQVFLSIIYALFGAAIVIAVFGVVNTLALSVIERTREIGVLRAVGASRRLVRRAVRLESVVICAYGGLLGIAVGLAFGAVMQHVMLGQQLWRVTVPVLVIGVALVGMVAVGVLAAMWPARRAARTELLAAIAME